MCRCGFRGTTEDEIQDMSTNPQAFQSRQKGIAATGADTTEEQVVGQVGGMRGQTNMGLENVNTKHWVDETVHETSLISMHQT